MYKIRFIIPKNPDNILVIKYHKTTNVLMEELLSGFVIYCENIVIYTHTYQDNYFPTFNGLQTAHESYQSIEVFLRAILPVTDIIDNKIYISAN